MIARVLAISRLWTSLIAASISMSATLACGVTTGRPIEDTALPSSPDAGTAAFPNGLVAYWKLNDALSTDTVADTSGNGNAGIALGNPAPSTSHPSGLASASAGGTASLAFDGVAQYVVFGNPSALNFTGTITLAAWVNVTAPMNNNAVIVAHGYRDNPSQEVALRLGDGAPADGGTGIAPYWAVGAWDGTDHFAQAPIAPQDVATWTHLAGTYDGATWRLYKNGAEIAHHTDTVGAIAVSAPWSIGARAPSNPETTERFFSGAIDEVRIYNRALTATEVAELYAH